ncbi:MAG: DoxX family membrane protein [Candidatus Limnocylindria bacterium]
MGVVRAIAAPMLSGIFIRGGIDAFRDPEPRARTAAPLLDRMRPAMPVGPTDPVTMVRMNAALQVAAGAMLATNRMPRLAGLALAASLVPTTLGGHAFWRIDDAAKRAQQRTQFLKNAAVLGGLLLLALD